MAHVQGEIRKLWIEGSAGRLEAVWGMEESEELEVELKALDTLVDEALRGASEPQGPFVLLAGSLFTLDEGYRHLGLKPPERLWDETPVEAERAEAWPDPSPQWIAR